MELKLLVKQIDDGIFEDMKSAIYEDRDYASVSINTFAGIIEAEVDTKGKVNVFISHNHGIQRSDTNLKKLVEKIVANVDWEEAKYCVDEDNAPTFEDEYAIHGERLFPVGLQWHRI